MEKALLDREEVQYQFLEQQKRLDLALSRNKLLDEQIDILENQQEVDEAFREFLCDDHA